MTADLSDSENGRMFIVGCAWLSPASEVTGFYVDIGFQESSALAVLPLKRSNLSRSNTHLVTA